MRMKNAAALAIVLIASATTGCATTTEYVEVRPECDVPPRPALPEIQGEELSELPDVVYWRLEDREKKLTDWALEMEAMLDELCQDEEAGEEAARAVPGPALRPRTPA